MHQRCEKKFIIKNWHQNMCQTAATKVKQYCTVGSEGGEKRMFLNHRKLFIDSLVNMSLVSSR